MSSLDGGGNINNGERAILHKLQIQIKIRNIYFDLSPSQFLDIMTKFTKLH